MKHCGFASAFTSAGVVAAGFADMVVLLLIVVTLLVVLPVAIPLLYDPPPPPEEVSVYGRVVDEVLPAASV
jgi:hypothetical protein